jgi:hypothetical protein
MKSVSFRMFLILCVLMVAAAALPAVALSDDYSIPDPVSCSYPWWDCRPQVVYKTKVVYRQSETMIESIPAEGYCYTAIKRVNVRSQPSIYATKVMTIKSAGTEFCVSARAKNSAGEIWYAVQLANGTLGYIRSDLVNTDHVILLDDPYAYEGEIYTRPAAASESASDVINIVAPAAAPSPVPQVTPQVIYVVVEPSVEATPTPMIVYVTPQP